MASAACLQNVRAGKACSGSEHMHLLHGAPLDLPLYLEERILRLAKPYRS